MKPVTIDFETFAIEKRPNYPPMPVGVSIKWPGKPSRYYAFGHRVGNNCSWGEAKAALTEAYQNPDGLLFQNAKFDLDVAETFFGLEVPEWQRIHDTMLLLFLDDPHQAELSLKPSAARLLDWPADEQDAVAEWLVKEQPIKGMRITKGKSGKNNFGAFIAYAPGDLVGKYADGDVDRTAALFDLLYQKTLDRGMGEAYDRERRLLPVLLEMERQGLAVDLERLEADTAIYDEWRSTVEGWVRDRLQSPDLNLDSNADLFDAMLAAGVVDKSKALLTPTGKYQTNKDALLLAVTDKLLLRVLKYRAQLKTCLSTFMHPWLEVAKKSGGLIYTTWNQVRAPKGGDSTGARTGRLSSTPNFQNVPKKFSPIFDDEISAPWDDLPPLPAIRSYITAFPGEVLIDRDFSQQELRILAHFEGGPMLEAYQADNWLDFHDHAKDELAKQGHHYERKQVKNTNFGLIYGMGLGKLAEGNGTTVDEAKRLKNAILQMYPGLKEMYAEMKQRAKLNEPLRTWGGREYYCEPPKIDGRRVITYDYKMVNVLIQGSAADCTKEAIIRLNDARRPEWRIILNVHDQITMSVPPEDEDEAMEVLRECMEGIEFDVPMLSEGSVSYTNWQELEDYDKKGVRV